MGITICFWPLTDRHNNAEYCVPSICNCQSDIMIGASLATRYGSNGTGFLNWFVYAAHGCCRTVGRVGTVHVPRVRTVFHTLSLRTSDRLDCAANAKINLICI